MCYLTINEINKIFGYEENVIILRYLRDTCRIMYLCPVYGRES